MTYRKNLHYEVMARKNQQETNEAITQLLFTLNPGGKPAGLLTKAKLNKWLVTYLESLQGGGV